MGLETYVQDVAPVNLANRCWPTAARMVPHMLVQTSDHDEITR